jgi:hypothetical protein
VCFATGLDLAVLLTILIVYLALLKEIALTKLRERKEGKIPAGSFNLKTPASIRQYLIVYHEEKSSSAHAIVRDVKNSPDQRARLET